MERQPINSSTIRSAGWENGTMEIEFFSGGVYQYAKVPEDTYKLFLTSESKGSYFSAQIRPCFECTRLHIKGCEQIPLCVHPDVQCQCWCHKERKDVSNAASGNKAPKVAKAKKSTKKAKGCICDPKRREDQLRINPYCEAKHAG